MSQVASHRARGRARRVGGIALLEVILAMTLFVAAAGVVLGGLAAGIRAARDVQTEVQAADLAVTVLSEIEMGLVPVEDNTPQPFEAPRDEWTWQVVTAPVVGAYETPDLTQVQVVVVHVPSGYVYRLTQLLPAQEEDLFALHTRRGGSGETVP